MFGKEFYPTPEKLLAVMTSNIEWRKIKNVLEPSAGRGDIADYVMHKMEKYHTIYAIDCIEIDRDLRNVLKGKNHNVVYDDFLTFRTFRKYDLIIMNPPFSQGAVHLMKALELMETGGQIVCILNAETLKNPYTNARKMLADRLSEMGADIEYYTEMFSDADRSTEVEVAVISVSVPAKPVKSEIYKSMKKKYYSEPEMTKSSSELATNDYITNVVKQYNMDVEMGIRLITEYEGMKERLKTSLNPKADMYIMSLSMFDGRYGTGITVNEYVNAVRRKYWSGLFENPRFTQGMTSGMIKEYREMVDSLVNYDFNEYNIRELQISMTGNIISGIEECIIKLFDELSYKYSYFDEGCNNIHYYNGWKSNKSWMINKKVILPFYGGYSEYTGKFALSYDALKKIEDIDKALRYLDGGISANNSVEDILENAVKEGRNKKIQLNYFMVTFYKKKTVHIEFTNLDLLKKLNIFGSQKKGWLPLSYGKKAYSEMTEEERTVIDEFEGKEEYRKTMNNSDYFLCDLSVNLLESA